MNPLTKFVTASSSNGEQRLRIQIDSEWTANDFEILFRCLDDLYAIYLTYYEGETLRKQDPEIKTVYARPEHRPYASFLNTLKQTIYLVDESQNVYRFRGYERNRSKLLVREIKYSSPGFTDIAGISGVIGHLKDLLTHYFPNKSGKEDIRIKEQERMKLQIENLKAIGITPLEIRRMMFQEEVSLSEFKALVDQGKIVKVVHGKRTRAKRKDS